MYIYTCITEAAIVCVLVVDSMIIIIIHIIIYYSLPSGSFDLAHSIFKPYTCLASIPGLLPPAINCIATLDSTRRKEGEGLDDFITQCLPRVTSRPISNTE